MAKSKLRKNRTPNKRVQHIKREDGTMTSVIHEVYTPTRLRRLGQALKVEKKLQILNLNMINARAKRPAPIQSDFVKQQKSIRKPLPQLIWDSKKLGQFKGSVRQDLINA